MPLIFLISRLLHTKQRQNQLYRRYSLGFGYRLFGLDWGEPRF